MMPRRHLVEKCPCCDAILFMSPADAAVKSDLGLTMMRHVGIVHPEAIGLPSRVELEKRDMQRRYQELMEQHLQERRN
jgi:hypothetical protein